MSVNYSLVYMSSEPGNPGGQKKYYARAQSTGEVTLDEIAEDIAYATTLTDGDVLDATRALLTQLNKHLAAGKVVKLENFGTFQLQLHSVGTDTEEEFTAANITGASVQFRPGRSTQAITRAGEGGLSFKRVAKLSRSMATDATDDNEEDTDEDSGESPDPIG